jgi:bacterioferritin (cytochrome b1)
MEAPNQTVVDNLQTSCQVMAHLAGQYQVDVQQLKAMGLKWLAKCVKKWYQGSEKYLRQFVDRLLYFSVDPEYDAGETAGADNVDALLERAETLVYAALDSLTGFRKAAWDARADYTPDVYEHAIKALEYQAVTIERERALIKKLTEAGYIGSRLEDGD